MSLHSVLPETSDSKLCQLIPLRDLTLCDKIIKSYEGRTESHEQLFFACELGIADVGECGGRWNQLLCYP